MNSSFWLETRKGFIWKCFKTNKLHTCFSITRRIRTFLQSFRWFLMIVLSFLFSSLLSTFFEKLIQGKDSPWYSSSLILVLGYPLSLITIILSLSLLWKQEILSNDSKKVLTLPFLCLWKIHSRDVCQLRTSLSLSLRLCFWKGRNGTEESERGSLR